jgi:3-methyladenine DNA glycosylase AlkD
VEAITERTIARLASAPGNTAAIRQLRKAASKELAGGAPNEVLAVAMELIRRARFGRFFAYELVHSHRAAMATITLDDVERLGGGMEGWAEVDCFGCYISGVAWREGRIPDRAVKGWAKSENRWWRRAALVSTVALNVPARGGAGDAKRTLAICRMLIPDRDDMVVKAMSWALRALSVQDRASVTEFLAANEEELAPRVLREVRNKLATGLKNPKARARRAGGDL